MIISRKRLLVTSVNGVKPTSGEDVLATKEDVEDASEEERAPLRIRKKRLPRGVVLVERWGRRGIETGLKATPKEVSADTITDL